MATGRQQRPKDLSTRVDVEAQSVVNFGKDVGTTTVDWVKQATQIQDFMDHDIGKMGQSSISYTLFTKYLYSNVRPKDFNKNTVIHLSHGTKQMSVLVNADANATIPEGTITFRQLQTYLMTEMALGFEYMKAQTGMACIPPVAGAVFNYSNYEAIQQRLGITPEQLVVAAAPLQNMVYTLGVTPSPEAVAVAALYAIRKQLGTPNQAAAMASAQRPVIQAQLVSGSTIDSRKVQELIQVSNFKAMNALEDAALSLLAPRANYSMPVVNNFSFRRQGFKPNKLDVQVGGELADSIA